MRTFVGKGGGEQMAPQASAGAARAPSRGRAKAKQPEAQVARPPPAAPKRASSAPPVNAKLQVKFAAKRSSSVPSKKKAATIDWSHPAGIPLRDIDVAAEFSGVVVSRLNFGVFVDVGVERDALLGCPARFWRKFRPGDRLDGLTLEQVDLESRRFVVHISNPEDQIAKNRKSLSKLKVGSYVEGVVEANNQFGVFVNIRAENTGRLQVPRSIRARLLRSQLFRKVRIDGVDVDRSKIALSLDDPAAALEDPEVVSFSNSKATAKAEPQVRAKEKPKVKPKATPQPQPPAPSVDPDIMPGDLVDGVVINIAAKGVMVDVGVQRPCTLIVSPELKKEFQIGDRVQGMLVEKVPPNGSVILSMEDPELELDEAPPIARVKVKKKPKAVAKPKAAK